MSNRMPYIEKIKAIITGKSNPLAAGPRQFTFADWKHALLATKNSLANKRLGVLAAGIAYFATLAFFPLMAASVAISSFFLDKDSLTNIIAGVQQYLPADIASLVSTQLEQALSNQAANVLIAVISILISLFSISGATQNLISAINAAYDVEESRKAIKLRLTSLALMGAGFLGALVVVAALLANTSLLTSTGLPYWIAVTLSTLRWVLLALVVVVLLAVVYRYAPNRSNPKWQWVSWGSVIASVLWMMVTVGFFVYARYFASFSDTYSTFAGIIVLMTWLNLTAMTILLGAEVNNQLERQSVLPKKSKK